MQEGKLDYWDWVSGQDIIDYSDVSESFSNLIKEQFEVIRPILLNMFWVETNAIYLNQIHNIPQLIIGQYALGVSQLGVSKRIRAGKRRLQLYAIKPKDSIHIVREKITPYLTEQELQVVLVYYQFHNLILTANIFGFTSEQTRTIIKKSLSKLSDHSDIEQYYNFLIAIENYETSGDFIFKKEDEERQL